MRISIVIVNWNGKDNTLTCLASVKKLKVPKTTLLETIVVDNASEDGSVEEIASQYPDVSIIRNTENVGFGLGNNVGIKHALENKSEFVLILNNDTIVDPELVNELVAVANLSHRVGIVSPKIYFAKGYEFHNKRYANNELGKVLWYTGGEMDWKNVLAHHRGVDEVDEGQYNDVNQTEFATGCCMLIRSSLLEHIGMFDEKYFLYYEDNDLSQRARINGYNILYSPNAFLWHKNAGSAGGSGSELQDYYITRNRLVFGMRYASLRSKAALIKESVGLLSVGRKWQKRGVLDFYRRNFGKGSFKV